jgi:predicted dithiol-disulfide oxidoreductase (DUF899 family)
MSWQEIKNLEKEMYAIAQKLEKLRKEAPPSEINNYTFQTLLGKTTLLDLFGKKDKLLVIHNMGQGCRWCTSWADGINAALPHLENLFSVVLVSKDSPEAQRTMALNRNWKFRMASHGGQEYISEQTTEAGQNNMPGLVFYQREGNKIFRKNATTFGPGDAFNPLFHIVTLGGIGMEEMTPQFSYFKRPEKMDDSGQDLESL